MHNTSLQVRRDQLATTRLVTAPAPALLDGQVRVRIERFALTANNITYGAFGDAMQYWQFFPVEGEDAAQWGQIPVWGFGSVTESRHPDVPVGEHLYGYFPMASQVLLTPGKVSASSLSDTALHRAALHPVYNQYNRTTADPFYRRDTEDLQALLRPLFITSWLIDDFLADQAYFAAAASGGDIGSGAGAGLGSASAHDPASAVTLLLSSASSKTAYGTAHQLHQRSNVRVIGLTSARNLAFCESLGCYDQVLPYEALTSLDGAAPCVYIDFSGNAAFRLALHTHCSGLRYSCSVGGTHVNDLGSGRDLPGPRPTLFFAPAQIKKRTQEWGSQGLGQRLLTSWNAFIASVTAPEKPWLTVQQHLGASAAQEAYATILAGQGDARVGHIVRMNEA